jgi:hypothetical protein
MDKLMMDIIVPVLDPLRSVIKVSDTGKDEILVIRTGGSNMETITTTACTSCISQKIGLETVKGGK